MRRTIGGPDSEEENLRVEAILSKVESLNRNQQELIRNQNDIRTTLESLAENVARLSERVSELTDNSDRISILSQTVTENYDNLTRRVSQNTEKVEYTQKNLFRIYGRNISLNKLIRCKLTMRTQMSQKIENMFVQPFLDLFLYIEQMLNHCLLYTSDAADE